MVAALYNSLPDNSQRSDEKAFATTVENTLVVPLYKLLADNLERLAQRAFVSPLDKVSSFLDTAFRHRQHKLVATLYKLLADNPKGLAEQAFATPLDSIGSFLEMALKHGQNTLVAAHYKSLADNSQRPDEQAFAVTIENTLIAGLYRSLTENSQRLAEKAFVTPLEQIGSFLDTAREHGQSTLVSALYKSLADNLQRLAEKAFTTPLEHVGSFLDRARRQAQSELVNGLWNALASEPDRLTTRLAESTPRTIMPLLVTIPAEQPWVGEAIIKPLDVKFWEFGDYRSQRFSTGAPGLALIFGKYGRNDLKDALISNTLRRKNKIDFDNPVHGLLEVSRLISNASDADLIHVVPFLESVCTYVWLDACFKVAQTFSLASALANLAIYQKPAIVARFWCRGLEQRLAKEVARLDTAKPTDLSASIQFLGSCSLSGWMISRSLLYAAPLGSIGKLPSEVLRHEVGSNKVDAWQRQLWFGLRVVASLAAGKLIVDQSVAEQTLALWEANLTETGLKPDGVPHQINKSMVRWLTRCVNSRDWQLLPDDEPLWLLTGFPNDPRSVFPDAYLPTSP